ncbi:hypothetical protein RhiirC2_791990 [Rhizophagus irregularis]|uniref:Uncharacterized protein n=1 Tax=Rhizophagus irregularis TaxID=588596 RepID=A0A2N1MI65_9GLOM|nr:hypothetical protein RhiirC2_791990 [Rhizophagus irregularis]
MPSSWYTTLVAQDSNNRYAIKRKMELNNVFVAKEQNHNAGYLFIRNQEIENSSILLLPEYVVFTTADKKRFKLSILKSNNQLLFFWEEFGSDSLYIEKKAQGVGRLAFHCILKKYDLDSNTCLQSILESSQQANAKKKEETLYRSLKQDQEKIDNFLCENTSQDVLFGIQVEPNGKTLSLKSAQALILKRYNYQPVIGFYIVENSQSAQKPGNDSSRIIHQGNFDGSSRQMKYAILIALLNNIMPILEETDFTLYVYVDGDLEINQILACIPAISCIFADLKHVSKNIQKNLYKYVNFV